jgi:hypothetical protein
VAATAPAVGPRRSCPQRIFSVPRVVPGRARRGLVYDQSSLGQRGTTLSNVPVTRVMEALRGKTRALNVATPKSATQGHSYPREHETHVERPTTSSASRNAGPQPPRSAPRTPRSTSYPRAASCRLGPQEIREAPKRRRPPTDERTDLPAPPKSAACRLLQQTYPVALSTVRGRGRVLQGYAWCSEPLSETTPTS